MDLAVYDPKILSKLETYEDYLSYYIQLDEVQSGFSWMKADLLLQMMSKLGFGSIEAMSKDIRQPESTIINYTRTAKAFTPEERNPGLSFSTPFQASFADSYSDKTQEFKSNNRFEWLEKAADNGLSTRALAREIRDEKVGKDNGDNIELDRRTRETHQRIKQEIDGLLSRALKGDETSIVHLQEIYEFIYGAEIRKT